MLVQMKWNVWSDKSSVMKFVLQVKEIRDRASCLDTRADILDRLRYGMIKNARDK